MLTIHPLRNRSGMTLVEVLIAMGILLIIVALVSDSFLNIVTQSAKQSSLSETEMEGLVGLEVLKNDLESAGFGLPWQYQGSLPNYSEAGTGNVCGGTGVNPAIFNDSASQPPRPVLGANNRCFNESDYLVIKATSVARNMAAQRWTYVDQDGPKTWESQEQNFTNGDKIILVQPKAGENIIRRLVTGTSFWYSYPPTITPSETESRFIAYGINGFDNPNNPRFPFNRADYYISTSNVPSSCAPNTGVLRKAVLSHSGTDFPSGNLLPLIDCVADFQVIFGFDMNEDGTVGTFATPDGSTVSSNEGGTPSLVITTLSNASTIRKRLKEIRAYILTHEGGYDRNYRYPATTVQVGDFGLGKTFNLTSIDEYQRYRWKVLRLYVKPKNFGN